MVISDRLGSALSFSVHIVVHSSEPLSWVISGNDILLKAVQKKYYI